MIRKALTLRASSIGDCLMGKYLLENIHAAYPEAVCSLFVSGKGSMVRDLLAAYPWIQVLEANARRPGAVFKAASILCPSDATVTQYSGRGTFSTTSKLFARAVTRRGRLVGFTDAWPFNRLVFDHLVPFEARRPTRLLECDALEALGIPVVFSRVTLTPHADNPIVEKLRLVPGSYLVVNLFSGSQKRGLSLEKQIAITRGLSASFGTGCAVVLTGGQGDFPLMKAIAEAAPETILAPSLGMQELITLVAKSGGTVSLDTGVGHIAAQTGAPLVVMRTCWGYPWWAKEQYSRTGIEVIAHDELCAAGHRSVAFPACLSAVSVEEVVRAVKTVSALR